MSAPDPVPVPELEPDIIPPGKPPPPPPPNSMPESQPDAEPEPEPVEVPVERPSVAPRRAPDTRYRKPFPSYPDDSPELILDGIRSIRCGPAAAMIGYVGLDFPAGNGRR